MKQSILKSLVVSFIVFIVTVLSISIFFKNNLILLSLLLVIILIEYKFRKTKNYFHYFFVGAILGTVAEIVCVFFGVWSYAFPSFLGIPMWLPFAWGFATVLIKRVTEAVIDIEQNK